MMDRTVSRSSCDRSGAVVASEAACRLRRSTACSICSVVASGDSRRYAYQSSRCCMTLWNRIPRLTRYWTGRVLASASAASPPLSARYSWTIVVLATAPVVVSVADTCKIPFLSRLMVTLTGW